MDISSIALFLHIAGALGFFIALGLEWTGLWQIRRAAALAQVIEWMGILKSVRKIGFVSMLTTVITGFYMVLAYGSAAAWIIVTLVSLVLVIALAQALTAPRMAAIGQTLATQKNFSPATFRSLANHPLLWISIQTRAGLALGIVFLKVAKPELAGSLLTLVVAILLGLASALPMPRGVQAQEESTD